MACHQCNIGSQQPAHRMANEYDVGSRRLMRGQPLAEVIASYVDSLISFVFGVNLGMNDMSLG